MSAENFAQVRSWMEGWCRVADGSRGDQTRFLADAEAAADGRVNKVDIVPQVFALEYLDETGSPSQRSVRIHTIAVSSAGHGLLKGYCYWRKAPRSFRLPRIVSVIDEAGEIHAPAGPYLRELFKAYAITPDSDRASGNYEAFVRTFWPDFMLLRIMAGIDDEVRESELVAIRDYAARLMMRFDDTLGSAAVNQLDKWVRRLVPESGDLEDALMRLEARPNNELAALLRSAKAVMEADGHHHENELALLDELCIELAG